MLGDISPTSVPAVRGNDSPLPAAITDVGCERELNEDRYAVVESATGRAWVVCDGMGGTLGGELAAQLAIDAIRRGLESRQFTSSSEAIAFSVQEANRIIVLRRSNPTFSGMGTTVVSSLINESEVVICSVGDSRAYLLRDKKITQLTTDHTYVQDLVTRGVLDPKDALSHPQAHVLTKCLGADPGLEISVQQYWLWETDGEPGDRIVLCTDGLYSLVTDEEIADYASRYSPQEGCVQLVELAKKRGGFDNITVAILPLSGQLREESPGPRKEPVRAGASARPVNGKTERALPREKLYMLAGMLFVLGAVVASFAVLLLLAMS